MWQVGIESIKHGFYTTFLQNLISFIIIIISIIFWCGSSYRNSLSHMRKLFDKIAKWFVPFSNFVEGIKLFENFSYATRQFSTYPELLLLLLLFFLF